MVSVDLSRWDITPKSGSLPFTIAIDGYLWRQGVIENVPTSSIVDGETVYLQWLNPNSGQWETSGLSMVTSPSGGYSGHFSAQVTLTMEYTTPGTQQYRIHYNGNSAKNLAGCEDGVINLNIAGESQGINPLLVAGVLVVVGIGGYAIYKLTKK